MSTSRVEGGTIVVERRGDDLHKTRSRFEFDGAGDGSFV